MVEYLRRLEIPVEGHEIRVPSWRPDLVGMADIAEEVGRLFGYNNIPTTTFRGAATEGGYTEAMKLENRAGSLCRSLGYSEILTYSFVCPVHLRSDPPAGGLFPAQCHAHPKPAR